MKWAGAAVLLIAVSACNDDGPIAPPEAPNFDTAVFLTCTATVRGAELACVAPSGVIGREAAAAVIGGQGVYVQLTSNNVAYDEDDEIFSADVRIRNLSNQILGSADGENLHPNGVRVFFVSDPVTTGGTGAVTVANASGTAEFTAADQAYFEYAQTLVPGQNSLAQTWEWNVPSTVESFTFVVGVAAEVQDDGSLQSAGLQLQAASMATDSQHTCAITLAGQAYCWGAGVNGKLGNGQEKADTEPFLTPQNVQQGALRFVSIAAGLEHTCALTIEGDAYCWGGQADGVLGNGESDSASVTTPVQVVGGHKFIQLVAGRRFNCGITVALDAYCWGGVETGVSPLGDGSGTLKTEPTLVAGGRKWLTLGVGVYHACGITTSYEAYCWGAGGNGRLGTGNNTTVLQPTRVVTDQKFVKIDGGNAHTCALTDEGVAWCWGPGTDYRLGNGSTSTVNVPSKVNTSVRFVDIHAMRYNTCALDVNGNAWCWGSNSNGKGGIGAATPNPITAPMQVAGGHTFVELAGGVEVTCGKTTAGEFYCWGRNNFGGVGDGTTTNQNAPTKVLPFPG